ncbi:MAG TPA: ribosome-associated translation inhibitor RaiA [Terriglobia bacterium]|nr:ribosome-associated translation inhibitor RaiA [Terriglobia bacterium]
MKHNIETRNIESVQAARRFVERRIPRLERHVKRFSPEGLFLRVSIEGNETRRLYRVTITMDLPGKRIATKEEARSDEVAIKTAFEEIERQVKEHKARIRGEHLWKRIAKRSELRQLKAMPGTEEQQKRETFFSLVSLQVPRLNELTRHLIHYYEASGDLSRGQLDPGDVVDAALIRAYRAFLKGYPPQDIKGWLMRLAAEALESEVLLRRERRRAVHIEEDIPETSPAIAVSTLGDEILDFYQPDEALRIEDILPDMDVPSPEQVAETAEVQRLFKGLIREMPREWRRALLLHDVHGATDTEVAKALGRSTSEARRALERAREYLREKLTEYGYGGRRRAA